MKNKAFFFTVISIITVILGIISIIICFFTDINDRGFLTLTLICILVSNVCNLLGKQINRKQGSGKQGSGKQGF